MRRTVIVLMVLTIISKITGFGREITLSYFFGASNVSDAYLISLTIPTVIFAFIGVGLKTTYIPMYSRVLHQKGIQAANEFTNNVVSFLFILCSVIVIFVFGFTEFVVKLFASGFHGETLELAIVLTRISIFSIYFIGLNYIYEAYLQVKNMFIIPALVGIPLNIIVIISIIIGYELDYKILAYGQVLAVASQLLLLIPTIYKKGYKFKLIFKAKDENIKKMILLSLPVVMGTSLDQINKLIDKTLASRITEGGISSLVYANKLNLFIIGIFVLTISTVLYPKITKMAEEKNIKRLKKSLANSIGAVSFLILPIMVGSMLFAEQIVTLLYGRGAFNSENITSTSSALFYYTIGMLGFGYREILSKVFYSLQDTKTPTYNAALGIIINIILNIVLSRYMGINGLALATSLATTITAVLLYFKLRKKIGDFGLKESLVSLIKVLLASIVSGLLSYFVYQFLIIYINLNLSLILSVSLAALIYFKILLLIRLEDVNLLLNEIKEKIYEKFSKKNNT